MCLSVIFFFFSSNIQLLHLRSCNDVQMLVINCCIVGKRIGPSCSKLTTSLVNDLLKFTSSDMQIY